jgi:hypothetical protein
MPAGNRLAISGLVVKGGDPQTGGGGVGSKPKSIFLIEGQHLMAALLLSTSTY